MDKKSSKMPDEPKRLLTLTDAQAALVRMAMADQAEAVQAAQAAQARVSELLAMIAPEGANGFDRETMTFLSIPESPSLELTE